MKRFIACALAAIFWFGSSVSGFCAESLPAPLLQAGQQLQAELDRIDLEMSRTAAHLGKHGFTGDTARLALQDLCRKFEYAVDCSVVTAKGVMVTIEPSFYSYLEGSNISHQPQIAAITASHQPVLSQVFRTIEGVDAADLEYPVFGTEGQYLGSVSMLILPEKLLAAPISSIAKGLPFRIWAMETSGRLLHERDGSQIGKNLFTSDLYRPYSQMLSLAHSIAAAPIGSGTFEFLRPRTNEPLLYRSAWQTLTLFGGEWRLVATYPQPKALSAKTAALSRDKLSQSLQTFAGNPVLIEALKTDNTLMTLSLFKDFRDSSPGAYAIQWINASFINRLGYPLENSLSNYDFTAGRRATDEKFVQIVGAKVPAEFSTSLYEGPNGLFLLQPVFDGATYLGMVYIIIAL